VEQDTAPAHTEVVSSSLLNVVSSLLFVGLMLFLMKLARQGGSYWESKDGKRSICRMQLMDDEGNWKRVRIVVDFGSNAVLVTARGRNSNAYSGAWRVIGHAHQSQRVDVDDTENVFAIAHTSNEDKLAMLRLPTGSKCAAVVSDRITR
jgi:hypothetical protein